MRQMRRQKESKAIRVINHSKVINSVAPTAPQTSTGVLHSYRRQLRAKRSALGS